MIALIAYKTKIANRPNISAMFQCWYEFYKLSGTTMPFQIFTDFDTDIIASFPAIAINKTPPYPKDSLPYGDWLRSELYDIIQEPFIYMDMDCIILKPVDQRYFDFDAPLALTQQHYP